MAKTTLENGPQGQSIEQLQQRYQGLNKKKIQAETQRDTAKSRLEELKAQARDKFGTDDVSQLQKKLDDMVADNERKRSQYQNDLDNIEANLAGVEAKFSESASGNTGASRR